MVNNDAVGFIENYAPDSAEGIIIEEVRTMQQSFLTSPSHAVYYRLKVLLFAVIRTEWNEKLLFFLFIFNLFNKPRSN